LSIVDIVIVLIILAGAYGGYKDGFLLSLLSFVAIILGVMGGFKLMGLAMVYLGQNYQVDSSVLPYVAFGLVFIIIVVCVGLLGRIIKSAIQKSLLGTADQVVGALFGVAKVVFMLSIIVWIVDSLKLNLPKELIANSWLLPAIASFGTKVTQWIGMVLPFLGDALSAPSG
jgi:membrane protein required for colicin V production